MIRIVEISGKADDFGATAVVINRALLDEYLVLTESAIVRMFDFTRYRDGFSGWSDRQFSEYETHGDLCYHSHVEPGYASFLRGVQVVHPAITKEDVRRRHDYSLRDAGREYASYIALISKTRWSARFQALREQRRTTSRNRICRLRRALHSSGRKYF